LADDQALDNVSIQGQPVGRMSRAAISQQLEQRYAPFRKTPLRLTFEGRSWTPTLDDIGVQLDLEQTANDAATAGRSGGPLQRVEQLWSLWNTGLDIAPHLAVDNNRLQLYLMNIAADIEQPPRDAALSIADAKVIATPAQAGRQVLVDATMIDALRSLQGLSPQTVVIRTRTLAPTIDDTSVAKAADQARILLKAPVTLKRGDQQVTWDQEDIAGLMTINASGGEMAVGIDQQRLARQVERLAQVVDSPSAEPRVALNRGKLAISQPGQTGWRLKQPEAAAEISKTLFLEQREVDLPVEELKPQVTAQSLPTLGIGELVGEGKTSFAGSAPYRITNIEAGARRMNGVMIAPGDEFSFNTQLGAVDESNGFVKGYAVIGNRTQLEWGGGVCQDSTTMFRAAFWAGLPITERHGHPFYISWYNAFAFPGQDGPGMDATIYTGVEDLKFVNDTGHWLLIDARADEAAQVLTIRLYGTKPNRTVDIQGPQIDNIVQPPATPVYMTDPSVPSGTVKQTDTARKGMDIEVYRIITENGVRKQPEEFFTRFKAWPNVFVRGTG
jgi:vancomycin resistance protein YoaR